MQNQEKTAEQSQKFILLDTETTGDTPEARLIELAFVVMPADERTVVWRGLFKPPVPITVGAMAAHHITPEDLENEPAFDDKATIRGEFEEALADENSFVVAHNAPYDLQILKNEGIEIPKTKTIDTLKVAKNLLPDSQGYALQFLRYDLGLYRQEKMANVIAHSAAGDVVVLALLFKYLRMLMTGTEEEKTAEMVAMSNRPVRLKFLTFGKHKGETFDEVNEKDRDYLLWLNRQPSLDPDVSFTLGQVIKTKQVWA